MKPILSKNRTVKQYSIPIFVLFLFYFNII
nr:MAG TPA: hypothetical protein [Caudoviricetes sp.]